MPDLSLQKLPQLNIIKKQGIEVPGCESEESYNPISFLNTYAQQFKIKDKPKYSFKSDNNKFTCSLEFYNQNWVSKVEKGRKQQAKEEVAKIAVTDLFAQTPKKCKQIEDIFRLAKVVGPKKKFGRGTKQMAKNFHPSDLCSRVVAWYNEQQKCNSPKPARVLILELCQMYHLGQPEYKEIYMSPGLHFFSIKIGNEIWHPNTGFRFRPDAKDHIANIAFNELYERIRIRETEELDAKVLAYKIGIGQAKGNLEELNKKTQASPKVEKTRFVSPNPCQKGDKQKAILILPQRIASMPLVNGATPMYPPLPPPADLILPHGNYTQGPPQSAPQGPIRNSKRSDHPYEPYPIDPKGGPTRLRKSFVSLLHEISTRNKWARPKYFFYNHEGGYSAELYIDRKPYCTGRIYPRKADAKADVSQLACGLLGM